MTWIRLDDSFSDHPKVIAAGREAAWLFVSGLCYSGRLLTDGFIPTAQVRSLGNPFVRSHQAAARRLVEVGLWEDAEGGYQIHDFLQYNPSKEEVLQQREAAARRQAAWRERSKTPRNAVTNVHAAHEPLVTPTPTHGPSRPDPTESSSDLGSQEQRRETEGETHIPRARGLVPPALADAPGFDEFWRHYPQRANRSAALDQYRRRVKRGTPPDELVAAACHLAEYVAREQMEVRYVPHAHRFLRDERDREFLLGPPANGRPTAAPRLGRRQTLLDKLAMLDDDPEGDDE